MSERQVRERHPDCEKECQQAVDYGVWPEHSCSPKCAWLSREETKDAIGETIARVVHAFGVKDEQA